MGMLCLLKNILISTCFCIEIRLCIIFLNYKIVVNSNTPGNTLRYIFFSLFKIISALAMIDNFDQQMKKQYPLLKYEKTLSNTKRTLIIICSLNVFLTIVLYAVDIVSFPPENVSFYNFNGVVTYCTPIPVSNILVLQFSALLIVLKQRFAWINEELIRLKQKWKETPHNFKAVIDIRGFVKNLDFQ